VTAVSASQALTADNAGLIRVNASAGNIVITLPLANSAGGSPIPFFFVREDTSSNTATVLDAGSNEDIPGDVTSFGVTPGNPVTILGDGGSLWEILSPNLSGFATTAALASGVAAAEAVATGVQTALQTYLAVGSYAAPELTFQPTLGNNYSGSSITLGSGTWTCMGWSALDPDYSTLFVRIA
jgi:hypothetical protein